MPCARLSIPLNGFAWLTQNQRIKINYRIASGRCGVSMRSQSAKSAIVRASLTIR